MNYNVKGSFYHTMQIIEREFYLYSDNAGLDVVDFEYYDPEILYVYYSSDFKNDFKKLFDDAVFAGLNVIETDYTLVSLVESNRGLSFDEQVESLAAYLDSSGLTLFWNDSVLDSFYDEVESRIESFAVENLKNGVKFVEDGISNFAGSGDFSNEDGFVGYSDVVDLLDNMTVVVRSDSNLFWDDKDLAFTYWRSRGY